MNVCRVAIPALALFFAAGCVPSGSDTGPLRRDAGSAADAQTQQDAAPQDAVTFPDAVVQMDAQPADIDTTPDALPVDADEPDAVVADADPLDAVGMDAPAPDADPADAGFMDAAPVIDAGRPDAGGPWVEIGTGSSNFMPLMSSIMEINRGPQGGGRFGGYNFWISIRALGFDPSQVDFEITALASGSGMELARTNWSAQLNPIGGGVYEVIGIPLTINDCCLVESANLTIRVVATDMMNHRATDERTSTAANECTPAPGGGDVCP